MSTSAPVASVYEERRAGVVAGRVGRDLFVRGWARGREVEKVKEETRWCA